MCCVTPLATHRRFWSYSARYHFSRRSLKQALPLYLHDLSNDVVHYSDCRRRPASRPPDDLPLPPTMTFNTARLLLPRRLPRAPLPAAMTCPPFAPPITLPDTVCSTKHHIAPRLLHRTTPCLRLSRWLRTPTPHFTPLPTRAATYTPGALRAHKKDFAGGGPSST